MSRVDLLVDLLAAVGQCRDDHRRAFFSEPAIVVGIGHGDIMDALDTNTARSRIKYLDVDVTSPADILAALLDASVVPDDAYDGPWVAARRTVKALAR